MEGFIDVYNHEGGFLVGNDDALEHTVKDLLAAVELEAPFAKGLLSVKHISKSDNEGLKSLWDRQIDVLSEQASKPQFQPRWHEEGDPIEMQDREYVKSQAMQGTSAQSSGVWSCRVFHGTTGKEEAQSICKTGLSSILAETTGWYGEGCYISKDAAYALRYCWKTEFWNSPRKTGFLVAGRACFSNVFPVTNGDDLRGKPIGGKAARGAKGCDAHFVLVRPVPPHGQEERRTYPVCGPHERHKGNELVISNPFQFLPEFIIEVCVGSNEDLLQRAKAAADDEDRCTQERLLEEEFRRLNVDDGEQGRTVHQQLGQQQNVRQHQPEVRSERQHPRHQSTSPQTPPSLQTLILEQLGTRVMDTLAVAKACGLTSQKDVNPTLHKMETQQLLIKMQEQGKRAQWRVR